MNRRYLTAMATTFLLALSFSSSGGCQTPDISKENKMLGRAIQAFQDADIDLLDWTYHDSASDPNELLGRPGQYVAKVDFWDSAIAEPEHGPEAGTIELFKSAKDLEARRRYVEAVGRSIPLFVQYQYKHKLMLLRLNKKFTPEEADTYFQALRTVR